jgi:flagellar basal-body rod protein FlgB
MLEPTPTMQLLAQAVDVSALRQAVYTANIANAGTEGYRRMEVLFDQALQRFSMQMASRSDLPSAQTALVVPTHEAVKLDEEMALMAQNSLRYQTLIGAFDRTVSTLRLAIREGRE